MTKQYKDSFYIYRKQLTNISSERVLKILLPIIKPKSVLDLGCGTGIWLAKCKDYGVEDVQGVDGDWVSSELLEIEKSEFTTHNFGTETFSTNKIFDLAICIEVVEHLDDSLAMGLMDSLTKGSDIILFSAAVPGQGGTGHINEQLQSYWAREFGVRGYICVDLIRPAIWDDSSVNVIYKQNMFIYIKKERLDSLPVEMYLVHSKYEMDRIHPDLLLTKIDNKSVNYWRLIGVFVDKIKSLVSSSD